MPNLLRTILLLFGALMLARTSGHDSRACDGWCGRTSSRCFDDTDP